MFFGLFHNFFSFELLFACSIKLTETYLRLISGAINGWLESTLTCYLLLDFLSF